MGHGAEFLGGKKRERESLGTTGTLLACLSLVLASWLGPRGPNVAPEVRKFREEKAERVLRGGETEVCMCLCATTLAG